MTARVGTASNVFLIPGQGGDPRGALHALYQKSPEIRIAIDETFVEIGKVSGVAAEAIRELLLSEQPDGRVGSGIPQIANYAISVVLARVLASVGIAPSAIVGQSFGEIAALVCAGVFDVADGMRAVCALNDAFRDFEGRGAMVLVSASAAGAQAVLDELGHPDLVIACINAPRQVLVSGPTEAIDALLSTAGTGPRMIKLAVPYASHHPGLGAVAEQFEAELRSIPQRRLRVPVFSPVRRRAYTDSDDLHTALADCVVKPVHLPETIEQVAHRGTRFIELGAGDGMCRCVRATVPDAHTWAPLHGDLTWLTDATPGGDPNSSSVTGAGTTE